MSIQSKLLTEAAMIAVDPVRRRKALLIAGGGMAALLMATFYLGRVTAREFRIRLEEEMEEEPAKKKKRRFSLKFLIQFRTLLKIMIPRLFSKETGIIAAHSITLITRTFLTIFVAALEGKMVKAIVQKDIREFFWQLAKWEMIALPATFVNSMIRFFESHLGLALRKRLTEHAYKEYFADQTYYQVSNLDSRLLNADQCLTEDITMFSQSVAHLYSQLTKPVLDMGIISLALLSLAVSRGAGIASIFNMILLGPFTIFLTALVLRAVSPRFGPMVAEEAKRKGHLRYLHSRIIMNSEEIAFYNGHEAENKQLSTAFKRLCEQMSTIYRKRIPYIMFEQFLMKYVWSGSGMLMIALPILSASEYATTSGGESSESDGGVSERTRSFTTAKNLLANFADAAERLMTSYKEIAELAGYTSRVHEMFKVFAEAKKGRYQRTGETADGSNAAARAVERFDTSLIKGEISQSDDGSIVLDAVPVVTPTGDVVVRSMSIHIVPEMHVLISGPNGCGKSSLFRILGGLWPVYRGSLQMPRKERMYLIPQRPYMTLGTLRDQVIYPETTWHMKKRGVTDDYLAFILRKVHLFHIVEREGGWDAKSDWMDVLSGGEKQRMGLARVFYHQPQYALLDECTSAVSIDVEGDIYQAIKDADITLLTVTHRPSLLKFHTHMLKFDGEGGYEMIELRGDAEEERLTLADERSKLEERLHAINKVLGDEDEFEDSVSNN